MTKLNTKEKHNYINMINDFNNNNDTKLDCYDLAVYQYLLRYVNAELGYAYPSQSQMIQALGISNGKLNKTISKLIELNLIQKEKGYKGQSTRYYFNHYSLFNTPCGVDKKDDILHDVETLSPCGGDNNADILHVVETKRKYLKENIKENLKENKTLNEKTLNSSSLNSSSKDQKPSKQYNTSSSKTRNKSYRDKLTDMYNNFKQQDNIAEGDLKTINSLLNQLSDMSLDLLLYIIAQAKKNEKLNQNKIHMGYFKKVIMENQDITIDEYKLKNKEHHEQQQINLANSQPHYNVEMDYFDDYCGQTQTYDDYYVDDSYEALFNNRFDKEITAITNTTEVLFEEEVNIDDIFTLL